MRPILLRPALKDYLWGGVRLKREFGKETALPRVAESWELAAHPHGSSVIGNGAFSGARLSEFFAKNRAFFGSGPERLDKFPVLVKLIDAAESLSIQVHPDDAYARAHEGDAGKTEMWIVLDHEPGAFLYAGFSGGVSRREAERRVADGTLEEILQKVPVARGDVFFLRPGTVHAIGAGILLAEVQQNSDCTYRLYDYGRTGEDGKPRPLHLQKALDTANFGRTDFSCPGGSPEETAPGYSIQRLARCPYFEVRRLRLSGHFSGRTDGASFLFLLCLDGAAELAAGNERFPVRKGGSLLLPAGDSEFSLDGQAGFLLCGYPDSVRGDGSVRV